MKKEKEIGMEKLIELLNEYEEYKEKETEIRNYTRRCVECEGVKRIECIREVDGELFGEDEGTAIIICKGYMFIQWLVDNDKIEREKFGNSETKSSKYSDFELSYDTPREDYTNILLMELAIQDEPIQFLIEILR